MLAGDVCNSELAFTLWIISFGALDIVSVVSHADAFAILEFEREQWAVLMAQAVDWVVPAWKNVVVAAARHLETMSWSDELQTALPTGESSVQLECSVAVVWAYIWVTGDRREGSYGRSSYHFFRFLVFFVIFWQQIFRENF